MTEAETLLAIQKSYAEALEKLNSATAKAEHENGDLELRQLKVLRELQFWAVMCRLLFILLLGGSVAGVFLYQSHIDNIVTEKVTKAQRFTNAVALAVAQDWGSALSELQDIAADLKQPGAIHNLDFKKQLMLMELWVLSSIEDLNGDGTWAGQAEWQTLRDDNDFKSMNDIDPAVKDDPTVLFQRALVYLKYETRPRDVAGSLQALGTTNTLLDRSIRYSRSDRAKANPLFYRGMIYAIEGDAQRAVSHLACAGLRSPNDFDIPKALRDTSLSVYWDSIGKRVKGDMFSFESAIQPLTKEFPKDGPPRTSLDECRKLEQLGG